MDFKGRIEKAEVQYREERRKHTTSNNANSNNKFAVAAEGLVRCDSAASRVVEASLRDIDSSLVAAVTLAFKRRMFDIVGAGGSSLFIHLSAIMDLGKHSIAFNLI